MIQINTLPIGLDCYNDGSVVFIPLGNFNTIVDQPEQGVQAIISTQDIAIGADTVIEYGVPYQYKEMGELFAWLQAQCKVE